MSQETRLFQEGTFSTSDGTSLYFHHWPATENSSRKVIMLVHRGDLNTPGVCSICIVHIDVSKSISKQ